MAIREETGSSLKRRGPGAIGDQVRKIGIWGVGVVRSGDNWDGGMREYWVGRLLGEDIVATEELEGS